jgi:hypothetical protein
VLPPNAPGPDRVQVTPILVVSFATAAVTVNTCPGLTVWVPEGDNVMLRVWLDEHPEIQTVQTNMAMARGQKALNCPKITPQRF